MKHGSLFSGIGGFDLAAQWMGWENVFHCEIDDFGVWVLKEMFPDSITYTDITQTDFSKHYGTIDIITGGFPCQPFSVAGERKGSEDDRFLWPEMLRAVKEIKPRWIVAENVYGLLNIDRGRTADLVCADLEAVGYEKPIIFDCQANCFGLPTMERHIWFITKAVGIGCERGENLQDQDNRGKRKFSGADKGIYNGWTIPEPIFCNVGERVSKRLDRTQKGWVKALGNAIPPPVAYQIFKAIEQYELKLIA
jgi:DNA-cytosine methyltransferase